MNRVLPTIQCIGLFKRFGNRTVLRDIHFTAGAGSILALVGPNGAGKTTLLKILAALITPSEGTARIFGEDVAGESLRVKQKVGYVPSEERSFYWRLTGRQNLEFFASHNMSEVARIADKVAVLQEGTLSHERIE